MTAVAYDTTPEPTPIKTVRITPRKVAVGVKAFFRIMELWDVSNNDAQTLLGQPSRSTFYAWKKARVRSLPHDTMQRISYVLGIYKALQLLFKDQAQSDAWIHRDNLAFAGRSALARMLGGDVTDLATVRAYLDSVRGQGA